MQLALSEDQTILDDSVTRFLRDLAGRDATADERRAAMAEFGLFQLGLDPDDPMPVECMLVAKAIGAALVPSSFAFAQSAARTLVELGGSDDLTARIASGDATVIPALHEPGCRYDLAPSVTRLSAEGTGFRLDGAKSVVLGAAEASHFLLSAAMPDESPALVLVPAATLGVGRRDFTGLDGRNGAELALVAVGIGPEEVIVSGEAAKAAIADLSDRIGAALAAEAVGAMEALMAMTIDYLATRKQFGVPIGSFQALQHRLVDMNTSFQLAKSMALAAALSLRDLPHPARQTVVSSARVQVAESGRHVGEEAIQLHGAMGMSAEYPAGRYLKRLMALAALYGDADWHLDRLAAGIAA